jgi:lipopolysaccharide/colanic/teichoic acid biosynthesis glycosyltransferase
MLFTPAKPDHIHASPPAGKTPPAERRVAPPLPRYLGCKRAIDLFVALLLLVPVAPVVLLAVLLVKLTSRGPAFYSQTRLGRDGRPYRIYKIRTMYPNCESLTGPRWATPDDPRITPVGRFLRDTHLDEFPQLWNVLLGDMSLVGPRPERPEFVPVLERAISGYRDRLRVRPGIARLAQTHLPADTDLESVRRKLVYDLYYVRHASLWLDLRIMLCTGGRLLGIPFPVSARLLGLPGGEAVEEDPRPPQAPPPASAADDLTAGPDGLPAGRLPSEGRRSSGAKTVPVQPACPATQC